MENDRTESVAVLLRKVPKKLRQEIKIAALKTEKTMEQFILDACEEAVGAVDRNATISHLTRHQEA